MKPSEEFLAALWCEIEEWRIRKTSVDWAVTAADEDYSRVAEKEENQRATIERLIAEREKAARIEGMVALGNAIHAVDDSNVDVLAAIDRLIAEERAR